MKVFLCHSSSNKKEVRRLASDLENVGIEVWLDEYEIKVGDVIVEKLEKGIEECDYLLIWLTKKAISSPWVQREWYTKYHSEIEENKVKVLPLLAEDCEIPAFLRSKKYADFRNDYHSGLEDLLNVFNLQLIIDAKITIETIEPVYWAFTGCPIKIHISASNMPQGYKVVVFQRNTGEDENVWHFQLEKGIKKVNETVKGKVWYGTRKHGNLEYQEILTGIVPTEKKYKRHPFKVRLDYDDFLTYETYTVYRDDERKKS